MLCLSILLFSFFLPLLPLYASTCLLASSFSSPLFYFLRPFFFCYHTYLSLYSGLHLLTPRCLLLTYRLWFFFIFFFPAMFSLSTLLHLLLFYVALLLFFSMLLLPCILLLLFSIQHVLHNSALTARGHRQWMRPRGCLRDYRSPNISINDVVASVSAVSRDVCNCALRLVVVREEGGFKRPHGWRPSSETDTALDKVLDVF